VGACSNTGAIQYDQIESHCLTRLQLADWEALLRRPEDDADRQGLEQDVAQLQGDHARLHGLLEITQRRAEDAFLAGATDERLATIERSLGRLRSQLAQVGDQVTEAEQRLVVLRSRPSAPEVAAELTDRVKAFWKALPTATPAERLDFNRWLLSRQPAIEFRLGPKPTSGGDRLVSLLLDGRRVSYAPLAGPARQWAREQGMVDPTLAIAEQLPDGNIAMVLIERGPEPAPPPRGQLELIEGGHILVLNPSCPAADAEPPDEWPWSALFVPGLASAGGGDDGTEGIAHGRGDHDRVTDDGAGPEAVTGRAAAIDK
jgi:hypothetical protein